MTSPGSIPSKGLALITVPIKMQSQIDKIDKLKKTKERLQHVERLRQGNKQFPIISCRASKLNFYKHQTYAKFQHVPLVSQGWSQRKAKGTSFMFHKYDENPAFKHSEDSNFTDLGLDRNIVHQLNRVGFETPTDIQKLAIPRILEGTNSIIAAETGNGKTLAFLAPILQQILAAKQAESEPHFNSPLAIILVPGRELVTQIRDMARSISNGLGITVNSVLGGRTKKMLLRPPVSTPDILVGSLGAVSKLTTNRVYKLQRVKHLVLDEVDTLLDDSFNEYTTRFLSRFTIKGADTVADGEMVGLQLTLVGATFPRSMPSILERVVETESLAELKTTHLHRVSPHVNQSFIRIGGDARAERLLRIAKSNHKRTIPTIVFSNTSKCAFWISQFLNDNGIPCVYLSANMEAYERSRRFEQFQDGRSNFISGTDLVSRGLNTIRARHVINFEFPKFLSDYIHRCGRVGRVGGSQDCHVTNFIFSKSDIDLVQKIEYSIRKSEDLPQVNANIKRIITARTERYAAKKLALEGG